MPGIFISYRRDDSAGYAGRLADDLADHFGAERVFIDVLALGPGADYVDQIESSISSCDALLVVIGRRWLAATDEQGRRRLDDPDDLHRLEIQAALERDVRIIPVLVGGAQMPRIHELPDGLTRLARRHAFEVDDARWRYDVQRLIGTLEEDARRREQAAAERTRAAETETRELAALYDQGNRELHARRWSHARECLALVQERRPGYRDTEALLAQVYQQLDRQSAGAAWHPSGNDRLADSDRGARTPGRRESAGAGGSVLSAVVLGWFVAAAIGEAGHMVHRQSIGPLQASICWWLGPALGAVVTALAGAGTAAGRGRLVAAIIGAGLGAALVDAFFFTEIRAGTLTRLPALRAAVLAVLAALGLRGGGADIALMIASGALAAGIGALIVVGGVGRALGGRRYLIVGAAGAAGGAVGAAVQYTVQYLPLWQPGPWPDWFRFAGWLLAGIGLVWWQLRRATAPREVEVPEVREPRPI